MSTPVIERVNVITPVYTDDSPLENLFPYEETDDPAARTHYINPPMNLHIWQPGMETQDIVDLARMTNQEVVALCGYRWVPKHNPDKFDVCEKCMKIAEQLMAGAGE